MVLKIIYCVVSKEEVVLVAMQLIAIFLALASRANATAAVSWIFRQKVLCNLQRFREIFACIRSRFEIQSSYFHTGLTGLIIHIMWWKILKNLKFQVYLEGQKLNTTIAKNVKVFISFFSVFQAQCAVEKPNLKLYKCTTCDETIFPGSRCVFTSFL